MNRNKKRQLDRTVKKCFMEAEGPFMHIDLKNRPHPDWMTRAYKNNRYIVMIDDNAKVTTGTAIRAMVQTINGDVIENHWSEMQRIKNEIFGSDKVAITRITKVRSKNKAV